jgi:hypothetical protein
VYDNGSAARRAATAMARPALTRFLVPPALCVLLASCAGFGHRPKAPPPPPPSTPGQPLEPSTTRAPEEPLLPVKKVEEEIVVAAWAEPRELPPGGGQSQILVRIQKVGGKRFPGVEVRLATSAGSLFSRGRILVTDAQGMTRDRLTTNRSATITLNAGGTRYRFQVPVAEGPPGER